MQWRPWRAAPGPKPDPDPVLVNERAARSVRTEHRIYAYMCVVVRKINAR